MSRLVFAKFVLVTTVFIASVLMFVVPPAHADFIPHYIIADSIFDNTNTMGPTQIDSFLNSFPSSCISTNHGFSAPDPVGYTPGGGFTYGASASAGHVIYDASQAYGINPQVLLATLQKEQSLVTGGGGCGVLGYVGAMGYGCPDSGTTHNYPGEGAISGGALYFINGVAVTSVSGTCVNSSLKAGFSQQVIRGAWLLKFGEQRSEGNTSWAVIRGSWDNSDDLSTEYSGPMTQGSLKRKSTDPTIFYDGYTTIDGSSTHMDNGATATLYWYTPHFSGNTHFYTIFSGWFGSPTSNCLATTNISGAKAGSKIISYKNSNGASILTLTQMNNTGSACTEVHMLNTSLQTWAAHIATAMKATDPATGTILPMRSPGRNSDDLVYVTYGGSGSVEVHKFSPDFQTFPGYYDVGTNLSNVTPAQGQFVTGDFFGRGYDQLIYAIYSGGTGKVELHMFDPSLRMAVGYYDVVSNLPNVSATSGQFVSGDFLGRGYDQLAYVIYHGNNGNAEVHLFNQSLTQAVGYYDVPTDLSGISPTSGQFISGNFLGRGYDQMMYVLDNNGQSTPRVETHMFDQSLTKAIGFSDSITTIAGFDPTQ